MTATLISFGLGSLGVSGSFAIGWLLRGSVEHRRAHERERRRRALSGARKTVARDGTHAARVSKARIDRGREMQTDN